MKMLKVVEKRKSVREYKMSDLDEKTLEQVVNLTKKIPVIDESVGVEFRFIIDGSEISQQLQGISGYYGKMIVAPHYFAVYADKNIASYKYAGYAGEWIILNAAKLNLGTCWIEAGDSAKAKAAVGYATDKELVAFIAVGWPSHETNLSAIYNSRDINSASSLTDRGYPDVKTGLGAEKESPRMAITEFVYLKTWESMLTFDELNRRGLDEAFYYMRLAPSWGNRQPWRFILDGERIVLAVQKDEALNEPVENIDAGIAMLYFEVAMHDLGISGNWKLSEDKKDEYKIPEDYFVVGYYSM
ncbi:MAG: nitroreductase family protein [Clostridia bacterium]|nr:nitroreductase family protein [Clostridia bacterium]